ncbi:exotoxin beta-grasp domain-containing protein [Staphylococcus chromogenes]|uniref:exotoxin beta-grasp domain-containing protein n=1 Tax=Staphylococcus chromogenes TaxID=46126 RepID=UPI003D7B6C79
MNLSTIAKTTLALSLLTTGAITTHAKSADAAPYTYGGDDFPSTYLKNKANDIQSLYTYYSKNSFDFRYQTGYGNGYDVEVVDPYSTQSNLIKLEGDNKVTFSGNVMPNIDVFVVGEGHGRQATNYSIGGITKSNHHRYHGPVASPRLFITNGNTKDYVTFNIDKEEISLKQIDFKLRHQLIKHYGLYTHGKTSGKITIKMHDNRAKTIDLSSHLSHELMGHVINSKNIKEITIDL